MGDKRRDDSKSILNYGAKIVFSSNVTFNFKEISRVKDTPEPLRITRNETHYRSGDSRNNKEFELMLLDTKLFPYRVRCNRDGIFQGKKYS